MSKMSQSRIITLSTIILATVLGFLFWLLILIVLWSLLRVAGRSTDFWAMTEALSTAVAAAAVLGAGYVAYRELNELDNSRHMQIADRLFEELNSRENIEARRWIFQQLPDDPQEGIDSLTPEGQQNVKTVLNSLDRVAFLTQSGWIPDELIMPWMNPMIVKAWLKLEAYVEFERHRRKEPDYYEYVSQLAQRCQNWRSKNLPNAEITWLDDAL
jgi:heme/copper-type cytochrome/quinol oxidase subunit 2